MTQIQETITIDADPERVWAVAGDIGNIADWVPALASSTVDGDQRSCTTVDGAGLTERIVERDDAERYDVYEITDSPMPLNSYRSVLSVQAHDGHSHVAWSADIEPADDAAAAELEQTYTQVYRDGLESLRARVQGGA